MSEAIAQQLRGLGYLLDDSEGERPLVALEESQIAHGAETIAKERGYPIEMAGRVIKREL